MKELNLINECIKEIDELLKNGFTKNDGSFLRWHSKMRLLLKNVFGVESEEYKEFLDVPFQIYDYENKKEVTNNFEEYFHYLLYWKNKFQGYADYFVFMQDK